MCLHSPATSRRGAGGAAGTKRDGSKCRMGLRKSNKRVLYKETKCLFREQVDKHITFGKPQGTRDMTKTMNGRGNKGSEQVWGDTDEGMRCRWEDYVMSWCN